MGIGGHGRAATMREIYSLVNLLLRDAKEWRSPTAHEQALDSESLAMKK